MMIPECNFNKAKFIFNNLLLCVCSFALALFSSCEQDMNIELKTNDKRLLVNAQFTSDSSIHSIKLNCSGSLITGQPQTTISGAKIFITDRIDTFYFAESNSTSGLYQTIGKCRGIGGRTYYLSISNIDIDKDGEMDSFIAESKMPIPIKVDSMSSVRGLHPNDKTPGINNFAFIEIPYNGPDYIYRFIQVGNKENHGTLTDRLGSSEINRFESEYKSPMANNPDTVLKQRIYMQASNSVVNGDTINFICFNFTQKQFEFLKEFDNNTSGDVIPDNMYDQLKVPANVSTNIEPSDKVAGYFFVYSISRISKVFNE